MRAACPLLLAALVWTVSTTQAQTPAPAPCSSTEARAFDFFIGSWTVTTPDGKALGENKIESLLNGCVLLENWRDARGREGKSWNYWHTPSKRWKQFWVDADGRATEYVGVVTPTGIRFEAEDPGLVRIMTFTRRDSGSFEQKIEVSRDGRKTWTTGFVGVYRKR